MANKDKPLSSVMIIGGGLGGLALAQGLRRSGVRATVYERDKSGMSRAQGFIIGINDHGSAALRTFASDVPGLEELLESQTLNAFQIIDRHLRPLMRVAFRSQDKAASLVNRWYLRELLTQGLDIQFEKRFVRYEEHEDFVEAFFEDGSSARADFLVGADGSRSRVRQQFCPTLVYEDTGVSSVGGWVLAPPDSAIPTLSKYMKSAMLRTMGPQTMSVLNFYFTNSEGRHCMIWGITHRKEFTAPYPPESENDLEVLKSHCVGMARAVHPEIAEIVSRTDVENILPPRQVFTARPNTIANQLPKSKDRRGRVVLLGDAAHAMTTHAGNGANTAFRDSVDLANALQDPDWHRALCGYQRTMVKRGQEACNQSLGMTNMLHLAPGWRTFLRDWFMWTIGCFISVNQRLFG